MEQYRVSSAGFISPNFRSCWCKKPQQRQSFILTLSLILAFLPSRTVKFELFDCIHWEERKESTAIPIPSFEYKESLRGTAQMWAHESEHLQMIRETTMLPKSRIKKRWSLCSASCHELHVLYSFLPDLKLQQSFLLSKGGSKLSPLARKFSLWIVSVQLFLLPEPKKKILDNALCQVLLSALQLAILWIYNPKTEALTTIQDRVHFNLHTSTMVSSAVSWIFCSALEIKWPPSTLPSMLTY